MGQTSASSLIADIGDPRSGGLLSAQTHRACGASIIPTAMPSAGSGRWQFGYLPCFSIGILDNALIKNPQLV